LIETTLVKDRNLLTWPTIIQTKSSSRHRDRHARPAAVAPAERRIGDS
jgi:hypothetical protein